MLIKNFSIFVFFTFISRILGVIRDAAIAYKLGTTVVADIFFIAFRMPNLFRSFFAEGAFSASFIPIYTKISLKNGFKRAEYFSNTLFSLLVGSLILVCLIFHILMPYFIHIFAPGIVDNQAFTLLVNLSRIMFPYLFFISIVSLIGSIFQVRGKFAYVAVCPIILNLSFIFIALVYNTSTLLDVYALAYGVLITGFLQLSLMASAAYLNGIKFKIQKIRFNHNVKLFFKRGLNGILSSSIYQLNILVDTFFASMIPGAVAYLYYADRLQQLPLALIGIALNMVTLPLLAEKVQKNQINELIIIQNRSLEISIILALPAAAGLAILAEVLVTLLYAHSSMFTNLSIINTVAALKLFAIALPAFILNKIFLSTFLAKGKSEIPAFFAFICLLINLIGNCLLASKYGHLGIVGSTIFSAWINTTLLGYYLYKERLLYIPILCLQKFLIYVIGATLLMSIVLIPISTGFLKALPDLTLVIKLLYFLIIVFISITVYFSTLFLFTRRKYILINFSNKS